MKRLLTVTDFATSYDLTVLDTVKLELGIAISDNSRDDELTSWIHQASDAIASVCKRVFAEETLSEVFRSEYSDNHISALKLSRRPVNIITSIVEDAITLEETEYEVDFKAGLIYRMFSTDGLNRGSWQFCQKVTIIYTAGYVLLDDLPYDIERACLNLIKHFNTNSVVGGGRGGDSSLKVIEVPGVIRREWGVNNNTSSKFDLPPDVMSLISPYIQHVVR